MSVTVIAGFPGVGKTEAKKHLENNGVLALDSDSSNFDKEYFPQNYIEHIKQVIADQEVRVIFISSHKEVRDAMRDAGITYMMVHPVPELKEEYIRRYTERGSPQVFIEKIEANWDNWITEMRQDLIQNKVTTVELEEPGEYMLEVIQELNLV